MKIVWCTDIHLDFLSKERRRGFLDRLKNSGDIILISGDICEARNEMIFDEIEDIGIKTYYILGNHDFYTSSYEKRKQMAFFRELNDPNPIVEYFHNKMTILPGTKTALIGINGWYDGRYGDYITSNVIINDFRLIEDFKGLNKEQRLEQMQSFADEDANTLKYWLDIISKEDVDDIILITHVPPFAQVSKHRGIQSDAYYLPFYSNKVLGDVLLNTPKPTLVLCGHTHGAAYTEIGNIKVIVGQSDYGSPIIQKVFEISELLNPNQKE